MEIINKIGLEVEFFLINNSNSKLVFPDDYGFETDDYPILGEFRCEPGSTRKETIGNYFKELANVIYKSKQNKQTLVFGYQSITPEFKSEILKRMGTKSIQDTRNIYNLDILKLSDDVVENGVITKCLVSAGLHIHFSKEVSYELNIKEKGNSNVKTYSDTKYLITEKQKKTIIRKLDNNILPLHDLGVNLKYRNKGFYEDKPYGFEYRSLPMYNNFQGLYRIMDVVDYSFNCLEDLDK